MDIGPRIFAFQLIIGFCEYFIKGLCWQIIYLILYGGKKISGKEVWYRAKLLPWRAWKITKKKIYIVGFKRLIF